MRARSNFYVDAMPSSWCRATSRRRVPVRSLKKHIDCGFLCFSLSTTESTAWCRGYVTVPQATTRRMTEVRRQQPCTGLKARHICGVRFGRLTAVRLLTDWSDSYLWLCRCSCGRQARVRFANLVNGSTVSCGCWRREHPNGRTHGASATTEFRIWASMITRCENPKANSYRNYGGRGIKVCRRWRKSFAAFLADMGPRPSREHSLDRYPNNDGDYKPSNCRWATRMQQSHNSRAVRMIAFGGERLPQSEWGRRLGIADSGIAWRLAHGWSVQKALTQPPQARRKSTRQDGR